MTDEANAVCVFIIVFVIDVVEYYFCIPYGFICPQRRLNVHVAIDEVNIRRLFCQRNSSSGSTVSCKFHVATVAVGALNILIFVPIVVLHLCQGVLLGEIVGAMAVSTNVSF